MVNAALSGELEGVEMRTGFVLRPERPGRRSPACPRICSIHVSTWEDKAAYDEKAGRLTEMFEENFAKYADGVSEEIAAAGPHALGVV